MILFELLIFFFFLFLKNNINVTNKKKNFFPKFIYILFMLNKYFLFHITI